MRRDFQNIREHMSSQVHIGAIGADDANVQLVRMERFRLVINRLPAPVRGALNAAVKSGVLGHIKKEGHKPEAYYHPTFWYQAIEAREEQERRVRTASKNFFDSTQPKRGSE